MVMVALAGTAALAFPPAVPLSGGVHDAAAARSAVPAYVPLWATATSRGGTAAADLGAAASGAPVMARIYLAGRDPGGLAAYATAASDPTGRDYRRFLTAGQVRQRFGS